MGSRLVIEKPTTTYREAAIAQGAEEQQYGGAQKAPKAPTEDRPRFTGHEREAHLDHRASARELRERASSMGPRINRRSPEDDYARAVGRIAPYRLSDAGVRTDEERRLLAGLASGDRAFIDEVARGLQEAAVNLPALVGLPTIVGENVLEAIKQAGKGGSGGGSRGGVAGGMLGQGGGGYGFDPTLGGYAPKSRVGQAGSNYGFPFAGGTPGDGGQGRGGGGGFAAGYMGSGYVPGGRGNAMDPKSPTGKAPGVQGSSSDGPGPSSSPGQGQADMLGETYSGRAGLPRTRADALFRARTWRAFNPGGAVTDDKPKDDKDDKPKDDKPPDKKKGPIVIELDDLKKAEEDAKKKEAEDKANWTPGKVIGNAAGIGALAYGVLGFGSAGVLGGIGGAVIGAQVGAALGTAYYFNPFKFRPADDGTGPVGPSVRSAARVGETLRPADDGMGTGGPPLPQGANYRPADDGGPTGPRLRQNARYSPWARSFKPSPDDPNPGGPAG